MNQYDIMIVGQLCRDKNTDYDGTVVTALGGAVLYAGYAAAVSGARVALLSKGNSAQIDPFEAFKGLQNTTVLPVKSATSTGCENTYLSADRERRRCAATSHIEPYTPEDLPGENARIYYLAGLMAGDMGGDMISEVSRRGLCALDVQGFLRRDTGTEMAFFDWDEKRRYLPMIDFLKTDAAESEILTGYSDRRDAAKALHDWGAKEIMITHNTEALLYDGKAYYAAPLKPRNLSGRTGRGDTAFAAYLSKRLTVGMEEAGLYAAALVSLKMETPGPFKGTEEDVLDYIRTFY